MHRYSTLQNSLFLKITLHYAKTAALSALLVCTSIVVHATTASPALNKPTNTQPLTNVEAADILLQPLGTFGGKRQSLELAFSTTGERFAYRNQDELELWQTQPLKRLVRVEVKISSNIKQMMFDPTGKFHYIDQDRHHWITPDLQQGTGSQINLLSPNGRYAVRNGPREGEENFTPKYNGATNDVYDLQEKRSLCQFPDIGWLSNAAFTNHWFAVQLGFTGPNSPKPLAVCEMATLRAFILPFGDASNITPRIDPQGRWLMVHVVGKRFFGSSYWADRKIFALPFAQNAFATNADNEPHPCAVLPCGHPEPLPVAAEIPLKLPRISPDGAWLVYAGDQSLQVFNNPEMKQVAALAHAPYQEPPKSTRTNKYRLVFSGNSRWIGLQVNSHLYRIDLESSPMRVQEVTPPIKDFNLQAISSDGLHWLVEHETEPDKILQGALWGAKP